jgi:hypothetical protein
MAGTNVMASLVINGTLPGSTASEITRALEIEPTSSFEIGDLHTNLRYAALGRVRTHSKWDFEEEETSATDTDPHGMRSLDQLAERFESKAAILADLSERYEIRIWMRGSSDSTQGGFYVSAETMRRLGLLSASFSPSIWLTEEEDEPAPVAGTPT